MATSVLDVPAVRRLPVPQAVRRTAVPTGRPPLTVLATCLVAVVEAIALLGAGLTGFDGLLASPDRPSGAVVAVLLTGLAGWVVLAAGTGAALVDGAGPRLLVGLCWAELAAVAAAGAAAAVHLLPVAPPARLPLPALVLLLAAVPVAKLLLAGSPSARAWAVAGPRPRERRPDPVARHRLVCTLTIAAIGLGLGAVAVAGPQPGAPGGAATAVTSATADR